LDAEENPLHEMVPTTTKVTNDPHLLPYPPKEGWWVMAMTKKKKSDTYGPPGL